MLGHRGGNVSLQGCGVSGDVFVAGSADRRVGFVGLLHHGSEETGELGELAHEDGFAEVDVAEKPANGIGQDSIGGGNENALSESGEMLRGGEGEIFLAFEVMKEAAFGEVCGGANVVDCGG